VADDDPVLIIDTFFGSTLAYQAVWNGKAV
jgi:thymidylate kinase